MAYTIVLLVSAAVWTLGFALPLQTPVSAPHTETAEEETIFDIILAANFDVPRPLTEGDIALTLKRSARTCANCKWGKTDGVVKVPFVIDSTYVNWEKNLIRAALEEFSTLTCIKFKDRASEKDYLRIDNSKGCWSFIGKYGGGQTVSLQSGRCMSYGVIQHEVMHALSFFHEHTRLDRDNYVEVMWHYVSPVNQGDFKKDSGDTLSTPYNYNSIMHYSSTTFCNTTGKQSLVTKPDPSIFIGQRYGLSTLDVVLMNRFYDCNLCRTKILGASGNFSSDSASPLEDNDNCLWILHVPFNKVFLQFHSFISSSHCDAKIIVYDGTTKASPILATIRPNLPHPVFISTALFLLVEYITDPTCSSSFRASYHTVTFGGTFTSKTGAVVSPKYPSFYPDNVRDTSIIIAPTGSKVSVNFTAFDLESSLACSNDSLVIRDGGDTNAPILGTYCGKVTNLHLLSTGHMMLFQFSSNNQINGTGFKANYHFVP
ncbi:astacin-like metalloendopeptidase isoform X2 [Eleutherodactylus coqui]|uniref:astacin-like metalloendopeptidase isoform X2 n=1 Tax=Eleutherodactylus coqui TaxID=57060 RepID=UPI0034635F8C